jgi:ankyrin repeat protein
MHMRRDDLNSTPLQFAVFADVNRVEMVKLLLEHGADVNTKEEE